LGLFDPAGSQPTIPLAIALATFTLGAHTPLPRSAVIAALALGGFWTAMLRSGAPAADVVLTALIYGAPWAFGLALQVRGQRAAAHRQQAVAAERAHIARELHDVVAHSLSVITLQAQAIRRNLGGQDPAAAQDLRALETAARQGLMEMRRLLGVLRADADRAPLAPQPGLSQLDELAEQTRRAGIAVDLAIGEHLPELNPGLELACYRIIQEALTNVRRHADANSTSVTLRHNDNRLEITVTDNGSVPPSAAAGNGLIGMRERIHLYGGTMDAGPLLSGGFRVHARLPLGHPA